MAGVYDRRRNWKGPLVVEFITAAATVIAKLAPQDPSADNAIERPPPA